MAIKRKAVLRVSEASKASKVQVAAEEHLNEGDEVEENAEAEAEEEVNEEEVAAKREEEQAIARKKELKSMYMDDLKKQVADAGLETGKKEVMIETLLQHEAKVRAEAKAKAERIRAVVVQKKEELEGHPAPELAKMCASAGFKGMMSKQERVAKLLAQWQGDNGVDKALAKMAVDERKADLSSKDDGDLLKLCNTAGVDPFVKEVMVDRIVKRELEAGRYDGPSVAKDKEAAPAVEKRDMVEAVLAQESARKQEIEAKRQEEEAASSKRKEFRCMSIDDLKKTLSKKGREVVGKKEDMVEALVAIAKEEDAAAKRKKDLLSMPLAELKSLLSSKSLATGSKKGMVETFLAHEAKMLEDSRAYGAKVEEVLAKRKTELETKTASELKEMCATKGLKLGVAKTDRVDILLKDARDSGEVGKILVMMTRDARREELLAMEKTALRELCEEAGADPLVKEVMIERLLSHENEVGAVVEEPAAKKARKSAK